ncbi:hypothetical protein OsI_21056 [Oryza sativa Indica Group]|uniref:Uncharacterized protein n=1 Tax=Oryza sativa subsp. indica TaxID=39946 RepID=A2Y7N7_ORYSI|nr:hypothetical protein OsI_21056 [Oryza sativa Indica Group]
MHEVAPLTETGIAVDAIITRNLEDAARDDAVLPTTDFAAIVDLHLREEPGSRSGGLAGGDEVVVAVGQPGRLRRWRLREGGHAAQVLEEEGVAAGGHHSVERNIRVFNQQQRSWIEVAKAAADEAALCNEAGLLRFYLTRTSLCPWSQNGCREI